jgi:hypothetical protein
MLLHETGIDKITLEKVLAAIKEIKSDDITFVIKK